MSQKITSGRMVRYIANIEDARRTNMRRQDAQANLEKMHKERPGFQAHIGNPVVEGMAFPMMVVTVAGSEGAETVNGQVFLDGNDVLWVRGVREGTVPGTWHWPKLV